MSESDTGGETNSVIMDGLNALMSEIVNSPMNMFLVAVILFLMYKIIGTHFKREPSGPPPKPPLPKLSKRDFTVEELKPFDGNGDDGRILMAVNGSVYDMTRGKTFYGPGGPYSVFAGRDASRGLATFNAEEGAVKDVYDDLSDLTSEQMESIREWEMQLKEKYDYVGRLLKPGERHTDYEIEEEHSDKKTD